VFVGLCACAYLWLAAVPASSSIRTHIKKAARKPCTVTCAWASAIHPVLVSFFISLLSPELLIVLLERGHEVN